MARARYERPNRRQKGEPIESRAPVAKGAAWITICLATLIISSGLQWYWMLREMRQLRRKVINLEHYIDMNTPSPGSSQAQEQMSMDYMMRSRGYIKHSDGTWTKGIKTQGDYARERQHR